MSSSATFRIHRTQRSRSLPLSNQDGVDGEQEEAGYDQAGEEGTAEADLLHDREPDREQQNPYVDRRDPAHTGHSSERQQVAERVSEDAPGDDVAIPTAPRGDMIQTGEDKREWQRQHERRERWIEPSGERPYEGREKARESQEEARGSDIWDLRQ